MPALAHLRGQERWARERADAITRHEQALLQWLDPAQAETPFRLAGRARCQRDLALLYCWEGRAEQAHEQMVACAETTLRCIDLAWPSLDPTDYCGLALDGAMAASLVAQEAHATTLFTYAARFASGLVTERDQRPTRRWVSLAPFIDDAIVQAYSLLRLGQLSGFHATLYPVPVPEARKVAPVWASADIGGLLMTIDTAVEVARAKREPADLWNSKKYLLPVLRTLAACLEQPMEPATTQAQVALAKYYGMIRNLADFPDIYLRVLDLQQAYPQFYQQVAPTVFTQSATPG